MRTESDLLADLPPDLRSALTRGPPRGCEPSAKTSERQRRATRCFSSAPGLLGSTPSCAPIRPSPAPCPPAWRCRAALASAKLLRLSADAAALRDLRFAVGDPLGPAANLL
jgi:hypothetical protein